MLSSKVVHGSCLVAVAILECGPTMLVRSAMGRTMSKRLDVIILLVTENVYFAILDKTSRKVLSKLARA